MASGYNTIYYETVAAYSVSPQNARLISGGSGGEVTVVGNATFQWVFEPNGSSNGFTGGGWHCGVPNTPLANVTQDVLESGLADGTIPNLNSYFQDWQVVVNNQPEGSDYVHDFMVKVGFDCFSTN